MSYVPSSIVTRQYIRRRYAFSAVAALLGLLAAAQFDAVSEGRRAAAAGRVR